MPANINRNFVEGQPKIFGHNGKQSNSNGNLVQVPILFSKKDDCCGCTACYAICPQRAISMIPDDKGFEYPKIDEKQCIRCEMCIKVCPIKKANACERIADILEGKEYQQWKPK